MQTQITYKQAVHHTQDLWGLVQPSQEVVTQIRNALAAVESVNRNLEATGDSGAAQSGITDVSATNQEQADLKSTNAKHTLDGLQLAREHSTAVLSAENEPVVESFAERGEDNRDSEQNDSHENSEEVESDLTEAEQSLEKRSLELKLANFNFPRLRDQLATDQSGTQRLGWYEMDFAQLHLPPIPLNMSGGGGGTFQTPGGQPSSPESSRSSAGMGDLISARDANLNGKANSANERYEEAVRDFEKATNLDPTNPEYRENLERARSNLARQQAQ